MANLSFVTPGSLLALTVCFLVICTVAVPLRLVGRRMQKLKFGADDVFIVLSWLTFVAMAAIMIAAVAKGNFGQPVSDLYRDGVTPGDLSDLYSQAKELYFIDRIIFSVQVTFLKLSILFFYRRVLCPEKRGYMYWSTAFLTIVTALWGTAMFFAYLFECGSDISGFWSSGLLSFEYCIPETVSLFMAISDFTIDVAIFLLPIYRLAALRVPLGKKLAIIAIFALGAASVVASLVRGIIYLPLVLGPAVHYDIFLELSAMVWLYTFESGFGLLAVCLPGLKWFFDRATAKLGSRNRSHSSAMRLDDNVDLNAPGFTSLTEVADQSSGYSRDLMKADSRDV